MSRIDAIAQKGLEGIRSGIERANKSAERIVKEGVSADPIVELKQAELEVKASAALVKEAQELDDEVGRLISEKA